MMSVNYSAEGHATVCKPVRFISCVNAVWNDNGLSETTAFQIRLITCLGWNIRVSRGLCMNSSAMFVLVSICISTINDVSGMLPYVIGM